MYLLVELMLLSGCVALSQAGMADLTHPFHLGSSVVPGRQRFNLTRVVDRVRNTSTLDGYVYNRITVNEFMTSEHLGTHIDAPSHFFEGLSGIWQLDDIPIEKLIAPAVVINIKERAATDRDTLLTIHDLEAWEENHGKIPAKSVVFLYSGWDEKFSHDNDLFGTNFTADVPIEVLTTRFHFPGMDERAAKWLLEERDIAGAGTDTPSLDDGQSQSYPSHLVLLAKNVYILEFVNNLGAIPPAGATAYIMPLLIKDGSGAPTRILAVWDEDMKNEDDKTKKCGATSTYPSSLLAILMMMTIATNFIAA